jgi:hemerythrin
LRKEELGMPLIEWTQDLAVGYEKIDDQHKQLFRAADDLAEAMWQGKGVEEVKKTVDFLLEYTRTHFRDEEQLMAASNFPGYEAQKRAHDKFTEDIIELKRKLETAELTANDSAELLNIIGDWLRTHIRTLDLELGLYLTKK